MCVHARLASQNPSLAAALAQPQGTGESQQLVEQTNHLKSLLGL